MTKAKKRQLSEFAQQKHSEKNKKSLNPFEVHINRDKQNVLGRKSKADHGLPGVSRAKAINKRKRTLLQEYKLKNKDNVFLDKRIGEKNYGMSEEDKAMARFAAERVKSHKKKNIFNLNDEEVLTHRGQTLEEIEKFEDPKSDDEFSDDENRSGKLDNKFVDEAHFGGGILSKPESGMSRKDLIDQLIAESKKRKAEKQKIREQTLDLTEKLDSEWKDLLPIVSAANKSLQDPAEEKKKADDYDIAVRQLKFEPRGTPSDKLKSEEEIVREEKEKLEALENDRLARMKGFVNDGNNEIKHKSADDLDDGFIVDTVTDEIVENNESGEGKGKEDDLSNDNSVDDNETDHSEVDHDNEENEDGNETSNDEAQISDEREDIDMESQPMPPKKGKENVKPKNETVADPENEAAEDFENGDSESASSGDDNLSDLKEPESSSEDEKVSPKKVVRFGNMKEDKPKTVSNPISILKSKTDTHPQKSNEKSRENEIREDLMKRKEIMEKARKELPYTYKAPESFDELHKLLQGQNPEYQSVIVDRIIKCNHWTLGGTNKEKLSNLFSYLLQHICNAAIADNVESVINYFQIVDRLSPYLYDLVHVNSENAKTFVQGILKEKHDNFEKNKKLYPSLNTLILFKLISLLFPTSDFRHPVVTPCLIFMSQILLRCRVKRRVDIAKGLFICTLILEYTVLSKRFAPSAINYLRGIIYTATPKHLIQGIKAIPPFKTFGELSNLLIIDGTDAELNIDPSNVRMRAEDLVNDELDNDFKIRAVATSVNLLKEFKTNFEEIEAAHSIFEPIIKILKPNTFGEYPANVRYYIKEFQKELEALKEKKLEFIVLQKKKPKPLRMYEPRIEPVYDGKRHKPMSKEKAEREKLLHKYKKEVKGAMREIRRDRAFIAKVQIKEQLKSDAERKRKVKEIFGDAAVQQSEFKKIKRKK